MVLILTNEHDDHTNLVCEHLDLSAKPYIRFHPEMFPTDVGISYSPGEETIVWNGERRWKLSDIKSVWYRRPKPSIPVAGNTGAAAEFAVKEAHYLLRGLYRSLEHCRWLNTPDQIARAENKPEQLTIAKAIGLDIPKSLITNDPIAALNFFDSCQGRVIYKALSGFFQINPEDGRGYSIFTNIVSREDLVQRAASIRYAPCLFQQYIEKASELRITIIGEQFYAAEIDSQASERSQIDWRHYDLENTPYRAVHLPVGYKAKTIEVDAAFQPCIWLC